jgi:Protein of unknown function DUF262/Protein of unknown function (DUF1524)
LKENMLLSARVLTIEDFFRLGTFVPATVQRDYVWDSQHAEDLFNDIDRACSRSGGEPSHGAGLHIAVLNETGDEEAVDDAPVPVPSPEDEEIVPGYHLGEIMLFRAGSAKYEIYDGLQRATALTILLSVIRDLTQSAALRARVEGILQLGPDFRILLPGTDRTLAAEVQTEGAAAKTFRREVSDRGRRIRATRDIYYSRLKTWSDSHFTRFGEFLLERTFLVVAETNSQLLARQAFITSNQRGLFLRQIDIFKGQIYDIAGSDQVAGTLTKYWDALLNILGDGLGDFMRAFDFMYRQKPQGPDHLTKLADHIQKHYGAAGLHLVLAEIHLNAKAWELLHARIKQSGDPVADPGLWRLGFFKWFEWKPLALAWLKEYRDKGEAGAGSKAAKTFKSRFEKLHRACMMITLAKFSAVDREKIFGNALKQWRAGRDPFSTRGLRPGALTFPPQQYARALETLCTPLHDDEIRLSLLRWLETMPGDEDLTAAAASASVEHVLPHRPAPESQWLADFPTEEERFTACNSIGNLALMDYSDNSRITNLDFRLKLPAIKAQAKKYRTLAGIAEKRNWQSPEIRERADLMIDLACRELNIPRPRRR